MCDMLQAKIDRLANGKSILCKSNTSKLPFLVDTNLGYLSLEGPGRRTANGWHQVNFRPTQLGPELAVLAETLSYVNIYVVANVQIQLMYTLAS